MGAWTPANTHNTPANLLLSHQLPTQNAATAFQNIQPAGHQCNCLLSFLGILCNFSTENLWFCAHIWEKISIFRLFCRPPFINQQATNSWRPYILAAGTPLHSSLMMPSTVHRCENQEKKTALHFLYVVMEVVTVVTIDYAGCRQQITTRPGIYIS